MIRLVFVAVFLLVAWLAARGLFRFLRRKDIDWTGVTAAAGFVALAFWLRHVTGLG